MADMDTSFDAVDLYEPAQKKKGGTKRGKSGGIGGGGGSGGGSGGGRGGGKKAKKGSTTVVLNEDDDFADANSVPWNFTPDEPAYFFIFGDAESVHAAMVNAPLPADLALGANPQQSKLNLRLWVRGKMSAVDPGCVITLPNDTISCVAYHNLTPTNWARCLLDINNMVWGAHCIANNVSCGIVWAVFESGPGNLTSTLIRQGPFTTPA